MRFWTTFSSQRWAAIALCGFLPACGRREFQRSAPAQIRLPDPRASNIVFGPSSNEWKYYPEARLYDLSRNRTHPTISFATSKGPPDIVVKIVPEFTALVVIDMQNYFLHPSCNYHPAGVAAANQVVQVITKCREAQIKVGTLYFEQYIRLVLWKMFPRLGDWPI
jgi:hypothetical protein